ncbi:MAG TPA: DUF1540 domain-containing protein [Desulfitobacteriaceae bacterium]|nr:DUF1540 domain-containing protein [Desulfitobacteriaceae bacterium]
MQNLKCTVDSCHYWGSNNHCTANAIEVNCQSSKAQTSSDTVCKTFKP